jgi:hypothetical protein
MKKMFSKEINLPTINLWIALRLYFYFLIFEITLELLYNDPFTYLPTFIFTLISLGICLFIIDILELFWNYISKLMA